MPSNEKQISYWDDAPKYERFIGLAGRYMKNGSSYNGVRFNDKRILLWMARQTMKKRSPNDGVRTMKNDYVLPRSTLL